MKKIIQSREDIELLINNFYSKVRQDDVIGYIFNDIAKVDWGHHLPVMYDFWETMLLDAGKYNRNAMTPHLRLNKVEPLQQKHFDRWLQLFSETVDAHFTGAVAEAAKAKAQQIAALMAFKVKQQSL